MAYNKLKRRAYHKKYYKENRDRILASRKGEIKKERSPYYSTTKQRKKLIEEIDELRKRCGMKPLSKVNPKRRLV